MTCLERPAYEQGGLYLCPGYRLPTEAEWEYAYRAGTTTAYYSGKNDPAACIWNPCKQDVNLDAIAWYCYNTKLAGLPHNLTPVGQKKANGWGLKGMPGNSHEWVNDWIGDYDQATLSSVPQVDPGGASASTTYKSLRVMRGGPGGSSMMRAAFRVGSFPGIANWVYGFRVARTVSP